MPNFFKAQPDEIMVEILKNLPFLKRKELERVDKQFYRLLSSPALTLSDSEKEKLAEKLFDAICDDKRNIGSIDNRVTQLNQFKEFFAQGANPNIHINCGINNNKKFQLSLLAIASYMNKFEIVRLLLKLGVNVNQHGSQGLTPIYFAVREGHAKLAKLLLDHKANPYLLEKSGKTMLEAAKRDSTLYGLHGQEIQKLCNAIRTGFGWEAAFNEEDKSVYRKDYYVNKYLASLAK